MANFNAKYNVFGPKTKHATLTFAVKFDPVDFCLLHLSYPLLLETVRGVNRGRRTNGRD